MKNKKYTMAAILGLVAVIAVSIAAVNSLSRDDGRIDLNDTQDYAQDPDYGMNEGNIDFGELYPEKSGDLAEGSSVAEDKGETVKNIIIPEPNTVADAGAVTVPEDKPPVSGTESASGKEEPAKAEEPLTQQVSSAGSSVEGEQEKTSKEVNEVLSFSAENGLLWPVSGSVVMNYSADHVIYHATLNQFRTNPAIVIACEQGTTVVAAATGIVTDISETKQTGVTVTMDIGDGYTLVYGQLAESELAVGDRIEAGEPLGAIAKTSYYYTVEGDNLYFRVMHGDEPVDPMTLLTSIENQ